MKFFVNTGLPRRLDVVCFFVTWVFVGVRRRYNARVPYTFIYNYYRETLTTEDIHTRIHTHYTHTSWTSEMITYARDDPVVHIIGVVDRSAAAAG
jgi:hypothetical protein